MSVYNKYIIALIIAVFPIGAVSAAVQNMKYTSPATASPQLREALTQALEAKQPISVERRADITEIVVGDTSLPPDTDDVTAMLTALLEVHKKDTSLAIAAETYAREQSKILQESSRGALEPLLRISRAVQIGTLPALFKRYPELEQFIAANDLQRLMPQYKHRILFLQQGVPSLLVNGKGMPWPKIRSTVKVDDKYRMIDKIYTAKGIVDRPGAIPNIIAVPAEDRLKATHEALFDLFLPANATLDPALQQYREQLRVGVWAQGQQLLMALVTPLTFPKNANFPAEFLQRFPQFAENGLSALNTSEREELLMALRREPNNAWRKFVWDLRKTYLYLSYPEALANAMAKVEIPHPPPKQTSLELPPSRLKLENGIVFDQDGEIDYLIVGTGPAGSLLAHELTRLKPGARIVMIENGPFVIPGTIKTESMPALMESYNRRTDTTGAIAFRNGMAVGGGSIVNLDLAFSPLMPWILREKGWVKANPSLRSLFHKGSGEDWEHLRDAYNWVKDKLGTRKVDKAEVNANNAILGMLDPMQGTAYTYSLNQNEHADNEDEIAKISAVSAFLLPALLGGDEFKGRLRLISDAIVKQILFGTNAAGEKVATGVEIEFTQPWNQPFVLQDPAQLKAQPKTTATIHAKNVILSAGTLGSANILLHSDVPNPNIGRGIVIHPSFGIPARFDKEIHGHQGLSASMYAAPKELAAGYFFEAMFADPAFVALIHPGSGQQIQQTLQEYTRLGGFGLMLVDTVDMNNRLALHPDTNAIEIHYKISDSDKARMREALKLAMHTLFKAGAVEVLLPTSEPIVSDDLHYHPITSDSQVDSAIDKLQFSENQNVVSSAHLQGSNKLGSDPTQSVVSLNLRVWNPANGKEIPNLYVVDSSVFPTSVGANPMQSIYTLAKLFIDHVMIGKVETAEEQSTDQEPTTSTETTSMPQATSSESRTTPPSITMPRILTPTTSPKTTQVIHSQPPPKEEVAPQPRQTANGEFRYVFSRPDLRLEFAKFLDHIFMQIDNTRFYQLIDDILKNQDLTDDQIYQQLYARIGKAKKPIAVAAQLTALDKIKQVHSDHLKSVVGGAAVNGYVEIGFPGRYVRPFKNIVKMSGTVYAVFPEENASDRFQVGLPWTRPYDKFIPMNDYAPISAQDIPNNSVDLVTMFIGLHHIPQNKLGPFLASIHRILRPGGMFVIREHDANTDDLKHLITVVHAVFNAATGETPDSERTEYRNFTSIDTFIKAVEEAGLARDEQEKQLAPLIQTDDPTMNRMIAFIKPPQTAADIQQTLGKTTGYKRDGINTYLTATEWRAVDNAREYADFIKHTPFYMYPYWEETKNMANVARESWNQARKEHDLFSVLFSEYNFQNWFMVAQTAVANSVKIPISWVFRQLYGEGTSEAGTIQVLLRDPQNEIAYPGSRIRVLQDYRIDHLKRVEMPRYEPFTQAIKQLAKTQVTIAEIAGQKKVQVKLRIPKGIENPCDGLEGCRKLYDDPIETDSATKRAYIEVDTPYLLSILKALEGKSYGVQYIHDF